MKGETVVLKPTAADVRQVRVLKNGELFTDVPVLARDGLTARELVDGGTQQASVPMEVILPDGDYELEVVSAQGVEEGGAPLPAGQGAGAPSGQGPAAGDRSSFLGLGQTLAGGTNPLVVIAWGHGGRQGRV